MLLWSRIVIEPLLLTAARINTFDGARPLTSASGFFFARDERLYLVTSRHVVIEEASGHFPDRIEIEIHTDARNLTRSIGFSMLLYCDGRSVWRQGIDTGGEIDVAVIELDRSALPQSCVLHAFTPAHLQRSLDEVEVGSSLLIVGFPLGFHDTLHHLPVVRQALIASSFGIRFQGHGYFLTDARTHRGTSGAPVVMRSAQASARTHAAVEAAGCALGTAGHGQSRSRAGRVPGPQLRLVCRHLAHADGATSSSVGEYFVSPLSAIQRHIEVLQWSPASAFRHSNRMTSSPPTAQSAGGLSVCGVRSPHYCKRLTAKRSLLPVRVHLAYESRGAFRPSGVVASNRLTIVSGDTGLRCSRMLSKRCCTTGMNSGCVRM